MVEIHTQDDADLQRAVVLLETPSITTKIARLVGAPMEAAMRHLPPGAHQNIQALAHTALHKAADAALWSLSAQPSTTKTSHFLHQAMAATTGAVGGALGLPGLVVELPMTTTIMLRSIADTARSQGFDLAHWDTKQACIEVFALGGPAGHDDATESGYYAARSFMVEATIMIGKELSDIAARNAAHGISQAVVSAQAGSWLAKIIEVVAARFGLVITEKFAAQAVPVMGGVAGATLNVMFTHFYQNAAQGHFILKRLEKTYGYERVKDRYHTIRDGRRP